MFTLNSDQVQKLWVIRSSTIKKYRNQDFLNQVFIGLPLLSFLAWFMSGFEPSLWVKHITAAVIMFLTESLIFICLFFIRKDVLFTENPKKYTTLFLILYDILSLSWLVWIFLQMGENYFVLEASAIKLTQIQRLEVILVFSVAMLSIFFSPMILKRNIQNNTKIGNSEGNIKRLSVLIGSAAGVGILLSNILDINFGLFFICTLGVLVVSALIFSVSLSMIEFLYFIKLRKILKM